MRVLAGLDLALEGHDWLLARAATFASLCGARLDLVYVGEGAEHLEALRGHLAGVPEDCRGEAHVVPGDPAEELLRLAASYDALVVGPREPTGLDRYLQGAMAIRILGRAPCPVYVPRTNRLGDRRVRLLMGVDTQGDRTSWTVQEAGRWTQRLGGVLDAVYAIPRSLPPVRRPELAARIHEEWQEARTEDRAAVARILEAIDEGHRGEPFVAPGEPEDALLRMSEDYDLVVMGNRPRRGLERLLLGGVARHVVTRADCDVLILPSARHTPAG